MIRKSMLLIAVLGLSGCDNSQINKVKSQHFDGVNNFNIGDILDNRGVCSNIEWRENEKDKSVQYKCTLKKGKGFFSFNEITANKLRVDKYNEIINNIGYIKNSEIEGIKNKILNLKTKNEKIDYILNENINTFDFISDDIYSSLIFSSLENITNPIIKDMKLNSNYDLINIFKSIENIDKNNSIKDNCTDFIDFDLNESILSSNIRFRVGEKEFKIVEDYCRDNVRGDSVSFYDNKDFITKIKSCVKDIKSNSERIDRCISNSNNVLSFYKDFYKQINIEVKKDLVNQLNDNKKQIITFENEIKYIEVSELTNEQKELANKFADTAVNDYNNSHALKGEENINFEYNEVSKKYIIKSIDLIQYNHNGSTTKGRLFLDNLIFSALNNINDVDDYMRNRQVEAGKKQMEAIQNFNNQINTINSWR